MTFTPARWARGPHLQTIVPTFYPVFGDVDSETLDVPVAPGTSVRLLVTRALRHSRGTVVLLHGLCGSARGVYMVRTARAALARGWSVVRMNLRNCGGTERLSRTLYNAGQSEDLAPVLTAIAAAGLPEPHAVVGFSLGGNIALRYAGLAGREALASAFVGINPPVDLTCCIEALERPGNRPYHLYFRAKLIRQIRTIRKIREVPGPPATWRTIASVRAFDDVFTAPDAGYSGADAYYRGASSAPVLGQIRRPALILSATDDPFVPVSMFTPWAAVSDHVRFAHPVTGGHCGYWGATAPRFWAAQAALDFLDSPRGGP